MEIELLESLVQKESADQFKAIAIVRSGGIGKTTLCQLFFDKEAEKKIQKLNKKEENLKMKKPNKEEEQKYCPRIWVSMSRQPDEDPDQKVAIIKRMLKHLGVEEEAFESAFSARNLSRIVSLLHQQLWGKKYLIVLDDACGNEEWYYDLCSPLDPGKNWGDRLAYGFPKGYGGAVIVTSRNEELAMRMVGEENLHRMMPLSDEVCWSIFQDSAKKGHSRNDPQHDKKLKEEVYRRCAGIPLAAKVMGQIMNKQLQEECRN